MLSTLIVLAMAVTVAAAVRSTWSPCGLSMLSTITPIGERARGHRYATSAAWFVLGALAGGATLGAAAAALAAGVSTLDLSTEAALGAAAAIAVATTASDLHLGGFRLPAHMRQVNETWLGRYRSWVYAGGFGWQIGVGLATYVTTAAVYLMIAMAALTASPLAALVICTSFGAVRGLAVLLGRGLSTPQRMLALHRRLDDLLPNAQRGIVLVQVAVAAVAAAATVGVVPAAALGAGAIVVVLARRPRPATRVVSPA